MKTFIVAVAFLLIGNWLGDQATLRECATHDRAHLMGGGNIECSMVRRPK